MKEAPRLLNGGGEIEWTSRLFADLQLDKLLSAQAISVLCSPCGAREIPLRQEVFRALDDPTVLQGVNACLTALNAAERAQTLWREAEIPQDRYHARIAVLATYLNACEQLATLPARGVLLAKVSACFSSSERRELALALRRDLQTLREIAARMHQGLLSFSDKHWLTPDRDAVSECAVIAEAARDLGFAVPETRRMNTKVDLSLSDAACRLYAAELDEMDALFGRYEHVDLREPLAYISELRFFLEMHALVGRAGSSGVSTCYPHVAAVPQYRAKCLFDISLWAKHCEHIIPNDVDFSAEEPLFFLIGANGGGKTTYLRAVGINLVLFLAGCPVFAREAAIYPFDLAASHFPMDERFDRVGRLDEELARMTEILRAAERKTAFILMNETFSGTDDRRGFELLRQMAAEICQAGHFCLYVTHFHEVMALEYPVLSAEIDADDENKRTYRIVKSKGNASSYAADILKKYRLDKDSLRVRREGHGN